MLKVRELVVLAPSDIKLTEESLPKFIGKAFHIVVKEEGDNRPYQGIESAATLSLIIPILKEQGSIITFFNMGDLSNSTNEDKTELDKISPAQW